MNPTTSRFVTHSSHSFHMTLYRLVAGFRSYGSVLFVGLRRSGIHNSRFVEEAEIVGAEHVILLRGVC